MKPITKASAGMAGPLTYILSDESVDSYGDVIQQNGWDFSRFNKNPIALFGHSAAFPIGTWKDIRVKDGQLIGTLEFAKDGTSDRIDEIKRLAEQGILRATSVGFMPLDWEEAAQGLRFTKQELMEVSLVSVPANSNAVQIAKSLHVSDETMALAFGEQAAPRVASGRAMLLTRSTPGGNAGYSTATQRRTANMSTPITKRVEAAQEDLNQARDALVEHLKSEDADPVETEAMSDEVERREKALTALKRAEKAIGQSAVADEPVTLTQPQQRSVPARAKKKLEAKDLVARSGVIAALSHIERKPLGMVMQERYGNHEETAVVSNFLLRASSAPATTTTTGWAAELVSETVLDFLDTLMPNSVYRQLSAFGARFTFGRNGVVSIPARNTGASLSGSFVGEGQPIPVRQGAFTSVSLSPKKLAVITTFTREIAEHSTPQIEQILRQAIEEDTEMTVDTLLLDSNAATAVRPAGLRNGITAVTAAAGGGFDAAVADIKAMVSAMITATRGRIRQGVWLMNDVQALSLSMTQNAGGDFPFAGDIARGQLAGYPVIRSTAIEAGTVFFVDAADFFTATGDEPRFEVSDQATLHMEDTAPAQIVSGGGTPATASPVRSMFQTDSMALRMILPMNWAMRRTGVLTFTTATTW